MEEGAEREGVWMGCLLGIKPDLMEISGGGPQGHPVGLVGPVLFIFSHLMLY